MLPFELTKDTPYLALSGELWSVFSEYFNRNWSCYKGFLLYIYDTEFPSTIYTNIYYEHKFLVRMHNKATVNMDVDCCV